jgi:hypothetical protein
MLSAETMCSPGNVDEGSTTLELTESLSTTEIDDPKVIIIDRCTHVEKQPMIVTPINSPSPSPMHKKPRYDDNNNSTIESLSSLQIDDDSDDDGDVDDADDANNNGGRRVSFGSTIEVTFVEMIESEKEKQELWYSVSELEDIKESAKQLFRTRIFVDDTDNIEYNKSSNCNRINHIRYDEGGNDHQNNKVENKESLCGMGTYHPSRKRYSKKYAQKIMEAYEYVIKNEQSLVGFVGDDTYAKYDYVASLATKWSAKNLQRAIRTGENDYRVAYDISLCSC